jgi:radical SAM protein with 4Fe4S-binding SPASM domain
MSNEIIDKLYDVALFTKERHNFRGIRLIIAGGDIFQEEVRPAFLYLLKKMKPIVTNYWAVGINPHHGEEVMDFIFKHKISVVTAVNMDNRVDEMIEKSIRLMKARLLAHCNLCLVDGKNNEKLLEMAEKYLKAKLPIHIYTDYDPRNLIIDKDKIINDIDLKGLFDLFEKYDYAHTNVVWGSYQPWRFKKKGGVCGFAESNFQIGPKGEIYNCYALQLSERNDPVSKPCGYIWDGDPIKLIKDHANRFGYREYDEECKKCEYFNFCRGGCAANKYHAYRKYSGHTPYCELNKYVIKRMKKIYEKLDFTEAKKLGWEVAQENQGKIPIKANIHMSNKGIE